jgi:hypothetical protein
MSAIFILAEFRDVIIPGEVPFIDGGDCVTLRLYFSTQRMLIKRRIFIMYIRCGIASDNKQRPLQSHRPWLKGLLD